MEFYRGVVRSYDQTNHTANVLLVGSMSGVVLGIPVAEHIRSELMVEGAEVGVLFFAGGASGVVVCTFGTPSRAWDRPEVASVNSSADQTVTTSWATYQSCDVQVTVPTGKTYTVLVVGSAEFECTAFTNWNLCNARVWRDGAGVTGVSNAHSTRVNAENDRCTVTVTGVEQITSTKTYTLGVTKSLDRNTEVCRRGNLVVMWWEDT